MNRLFLSFNSDVRLNGSQEELVTSFTGRAALPLSL
jgi:hypothetical protein